MSGSTKDKDWFVYILESETYKTPKGHPLRYIGISVDVLARLNKHNSGKGAKATRGKGPWRILAYAYAGNNRGQAQWWEFFVRQLKKNERENWIKENGYKKDSNNHQTDKTSEVCES